MDKKSRKKKECYLKRNHVRPVDQLIAKRLKRAWEKYRKKNKLTQIQLAKKMGMGQSAISQFLNGYLTFNISNVIKFSSALEIDPLELAPEFKSAINAAKRAGSVEIAGEFDVKSGEFKAFPDGMILEGMKMPIVGIKALYAKQGAKLKTIYLIKNEVDSEEDVLKILTNDSGCYVQIDGKVTPKDVIGDSFKVKKFSIVGTISPAIMKSI